MLELESELEGIQAMQGWQEWQAQHLGSVVNCCFAVAKRRTMAKEREQEREQEHERQLAPLSV